MPADLDDLRRQRQRLFDRISWWEEHRHEALVPLVLAFFGAGWGLGWLAHVLVGAPYQVEYFVAVAFVLASGRVIDRAFAPARLDALDGQIARAERAVKTGPNPAAPR